MSHHRQRFEAGEGGSRKPLARSVRGSAAVRIACVGVLTLDWIDMGDGAYKGPFAAGNALYAALGAWLAEGRPTVVAKVADDYPRSVLDEFAARGMTVACGRAATRAPLSMLLREEEETRVVRYHPSSGRGGDLFVRPADLSDLAADSVHVCIGQSDAELDVLAALSRKRLPTTVDCVLVGQPAPDCRERLIGLLPSVEAFLPSLSEVRRLWPGLPLDRVFAALHDAGCRTVVVKMGARGCVGSVDGRSSFVPAVPSRMVDATGAGDVFCGAFHCEWLRSGNIHEAMAWGAAAASIVLEGYGVLHAAREDARRRAAARQPIAASAVADIGPEDPLLTARGG